ncbi:hypothetical protein V0M98_33785 (plasmid) [Pseudomonas silesiensis]|uniref:hypothetical protein n=1 Tax=Pseudomonas silesiensis TaxID=1853130 RepID=UPI0030CA9674
MSDPTKWKAIDANRAVRSVKAGATVWKLNSPFFSGGATYAHGLQTSRGTNYVVSNWVMSSVVAAQAEMAQLALEATRPGGREESSVFQP